MKKGNNSGNDDFSFSTGGEDEFFPLNVDKNKDTKAPKGVKGYLKNVARSVVNLGVKTGKHLYPEAFELGEKFKPDTTSTTDTKAYIASWKAETKKYFDIGKDIVGSALKDAKEAVKTGKFVKTEEERNNAEEMFGDMFGDDGFDFGGDSVSFDSDIGGDDSNFDLGSDDDSGSVGATLNVGSAVVKSSYANARLNTKLSEKTNATIVGATQTQIKSDRAMFAQNLEISQEQHRQKMLMMTNIATNIGKIIEQGNVAIKAQMEFSAKQLAFSQDLAAMVKEVRDAQWAQIKPKKLDDVKKSKFQSIFGSGKTSGFNFGEFKKNFFSHMKSEAAGGAFDMLGTGKEMIDMMMDMGGGTGALKNMLTDMLFESAVDSITGSRAFYGARLLNSKLEGLPGAINRKLNSISKRGAPGLENLLRKLPFGIGNKITLKDIAGWAHVDNDVKLKSGKYDMDPSEVHPFDNAAHKALTEVIPWQLAKIDAGINRTEQEYFNYKRNKWEKVSSIRKRLDRTREEVLEYSNGYSAINDRLAAGIDLKNSYKQILTEYETNPTFRAGYYNKTWDKDKAQSAVNLSSEAKKFIMKNKKILIHNVMMVASDEEMDDVLASLLDSESDNFPRFFEGVPSPTGELTEEIVAYYLYNTIKEFSKAEPQEWISFQTDLASYKNKLTSNNFENEDKYFGAGAGIAFDASISSDIFENERNELNKEREKLEKKRKVLLSKDAKTKKLEDLSSKYLGKKVESIKDIDEQLKRLRAAERDLNEREATSTTGMLKVHSPSDADKFIISDLHDSSTNGLINNIFNLLLTGLDVYVKNPSGKQHDYHKQIIDNALSIKEAAIRKSKASEYEEDESSAFGVDSVSKTLADRESSFISDENAFGSKLIAKIPGMKSVYKAFNKVTNGVNSLGNTILGENFYSVHDSFQPIDENGEYFRTVLTEEERSKYRELKNLYDSAPKEAKDKIKSEIKKLLMKTKDSKAAKSLKFGANIFTSAFNRSELSKTTKLLGSRLSKVSIKGKTIGEIVSEIKDPTLIEKLNAVESVNDKIDILLSYDNPKINKIKQDLIKFKQTVTSSMDKPFGGMIVLAKQKGKEQLDKLIKNTLVKKLKKIKVGDKTLGEVLGEIAKKDPSFGEKIDSFTTMTDLAEFLLQSSNPELQPFKKAIRELKDKHMDDEAQGGVAGIVGMGLVTGFDMIKKAIDGVKNLFSKRKKDANEELSIIEKYVHPDIVKLFGGTKATMDVIDSLGIDVELAFKDNEYHKASKQIEFILDANKSVKRLNGKQKRALKGLMRSELDKEAASASINSINSNISSINNNFQNEMSKYGDSMSASEKKRLESMRDEDLDRENRKLDKAKKRKDKASRKINKALGEEDGIEGNSASEQREAKAKAKEEKERANENKMRFGLLSTLVSTITGWKKNGFKLDDETTDKMQDAISEGAKEGSSEGWSGKISKFMDNTGLSKTKLGKGIQFAVNKGGSIVRHITGNRTITSFLGKSKIGSTVLGAVSKFGGTAVGGSSIVSGAAAAAAGGGGALGGLIKILQKILSTPKILAKLGKTGVKSVISGIKTGAKRVLTKIFPKLATLNGMATNMIGWAALGATAFTNFIKGMSRAKTTFNIGRGLRPTNGMRTACGLAAMFDGLLLGIPGIICKAMGFRNAEEWFYSLVGKDAEKEALGRYAKYNNMRATIFGIDDPQNLIAYENRNLEQGGNFFDNLGSGAKRLGRSIANLATFGIAKNNDERDSQLLGFQSVDIFKMWKERKYTPLTTECVDRAIVKLREEKKDDETLANMDDTELKKYLEQMNAVSKEDLDNNGDGEVDENSKAEAEAAALEHQNTYRKIYLEICRAYVLENKIAWLTSHCSIEKFKKYTGQNAQTDLSGKDRVNRAAGIIATPMGSLVSSVLKKKGAITEKEAKSIKKVGSAASMIAVATLLGGPLGGLLVGGGIALVAGAKKVLKERKHIGRAIANVFRRGATKGLIMDPYTLMERTRTMKRFNNTKKARDNFVKKLIEIADKYGEGHIDEWKEFNNKLNDYNSVMNPGIGEQMAETFAKCSNYKYQDDDGNVTDMVNSTLGITIPKDHPDRDIIAIASGMVGWVSEYMPELDGMCQSIYGMTIKHLAVKVIVNGEKIAKAANNYEKYITRRAEILGAPQDKLKAYESGLMGGDRATGWGRFKAGFKSFFSKKDSDELDSNRIGFEDVKIYKYWKQHKYDPIIAIEKRIAGKYGKYLEIIDKHCEDVEAQNKFINKFLKEATKYVNDNKLAWLTTKTTLQEFEELENNGFKSGATMTTIDAMREKRQAELQAQLSQAKQGSRKYKKLQKELERMGMSTTGSTSSNNIDLKRDFDELSAELMKNYDKAGLDAHETASTTIRDDIWKPIGGNFYGDNPGMVARNDITDIGAERGGPDSFGTLGSTDNIRILKEKAKNGAQNALNQIKQRSDKVANSVRNVAKKAPGLLDKVSSKVSVKQSPINDFVIDFKNELINKLNILDEIHNEQLRHNNVSEEFYSVLLNMVAIMAKSQGNPRIASQLDAMVKQVSK